MKSQSPALVRRLGARDATLIVMGGIVGSGIFMNPSVVARLVGSGSLVMAVWMAGGAIALLGAGIFAELAARRPHDGGSYAYHARCLSSGARLHLRLDAAARLAERRDGGGGGHLRELFHSAYAAARFAGDRRRRCDRGGRDLHRRQCTGRSHRDDTQNVFMVVKVLDDRCLCRIGIFVVGHAAVTAMPVVPLPATGGTFAVIGLAMVPVLFAYSGYQTSSFMTAELNQPQCRCRAA